VLELTTKIEKSRQVNFGIDQEPKDRSVSCSTTRKKGKKRGKGGVVEEEEGGQSPPKLLDAFVGQQSITDTRFGKKLCRVGMPSGGDRRDGRRGRS